MSTERNKILLTEQNGRLVVLEPQGTGVGFRYAELQRETNAVRRLLEVPGGADLVVDLGKLDYFGSEFIGALISLARVAANHGGKVAICSAAPEMRAVLENMRLNKLWPYYETRAEALAALEP